MSSTNEQMTLTPATSESSLSMDSTVAGFPMRCIFSTMLCGDFRRVLMFSMGFLSYPLLNSMLSTLNLVSISIIAAV